MKQDLTNYVGREGFEPPVSQSTRFTVWRNSTVVTDAP